jgi:lipoyl(octanoyl) transferase
MDLGVRYFGKNVEPLDADQAMNNYIAQHTKDTLDEIWLFELKPSYIHGIENVDISLPAINDIPVVKSDRGGLMTYHGPGQLIVCVLLDLGRMQLHPVAFMQTLEKSLSAVLNTYGINTQTKEGAPGVFVGDAKIASVGMRIQRGLTTHGLSLNIDMDLEPFKAISTCGFEDLAMVQMSQFKPSTVVNDVAKELAAELASAFGFDSLLELDNELAKLAFTEEYN